uniref:Uncharacterized protein n=1 Tax=Arundo donax TaxID=35708 RepID=A0A0A9F9C1_ARUDO
MPKQVKGTEAFARGNNGRSESKRVR